MFPGFIRETATRFLRDEGATTAIEYSLIATLVGIAIVIGTTALGTTLRTQFYETFPDALAGTTP
jgi:pilus assembly protein Flp/PilA